MTRENLTINGLYTNVFEHQSTSIDHSDSGFSVSKTKQKTRKYTRLFKPISTSNLKAAYNACVQ